MILRQWWGSLRSTHPTLRQNPPPQQELPRPSDTHHCGAEAANDTPAPTQSTNPTEHFGDTVDLSKRATLAAAVGGIAALAFLRATPQARGQTFNPRLIRPPGALEEREFLKRCTACGLCMKICPTGGLQPCWGEAGLEGLWTPRLVPAVGECDYTCNLCGQACPTGAIQPLSVEEKQKTKIGLAAFDVTRCKPYAYGHECIVCEEHCPIPEKAIFCVEVEVQDHEGNKRVVKQPRIDANRCIGCGKCENVCPFKDGPAVRVASANEDRNAANQSVPPWSSPY
jgi:MauM/NapG family ferredoxin protein